MQVFSRVDKGKTRASNQDACFHNFLEDGTALAIVCDGMGGANAGNIASETAIKVISEYVMTSYREGMDSFDAENLLKNAVISANSVVYNMSVDNAELKGMGTTAVAALVNSNFTVICHVGDSRAYLIDGDNITQLTRDHSMVQSLVESGKLTPEQARVHPRKNIITRALGADEDVLPEISETDISNGQILLLCSDGLSNYVEADEMLEICKNNDISRLADVLTDTANANGGGDNITVVAVTL